jgi:hypothetical protein
MCAPWDEKALQRPLRWRAKDREARADKEDKASRRSLVVGAKPILNGPDLRAQYAADDIRTAAAEVGHYPRRETVAVATMTRTTGPMPQHC